MSAVQLPHDYRGERLCRHQRPGRCTWWCSYRRGVVTIGPFFALILGWMIFRWTTGDQEDRDQVIHALVAAGMFLGVCVPVLLVANRASDRR